MEDRALNGPPQRLRKGLDLLPGRPGEADLRSLTYAPSLSQALAGEGGRVIAWARISLNLFPGSVSPDFPAQTVQPGLQRI